ncbi:MAG TPA: hypothetical protein VHZ24_00530 [Pirellulales bacterium]|jgi:hypothetical protein|nr:hypothetical protein [Pirellulales bacterium]
MSHKAPRIEQLARLVEKLVAAATNLSDEEVDGLAALADEPAIRGPSPDISAWFKAICASEQKRRPGQNVLFPPPPDWGRWSDADAAGALEAMIHLTNSAAVASDLVRDLTDVALTLVAGVAMNRLRLRAIASSN